MSRSFGDEPSRAGQSGQTVLVVEDEGIIRELAARVLRRAGYVVIEAGGAEDALGAVGTGPRKLDLLVSDISLESRRGGLFLFEDLRRRNGELRAVFISGYSVDRLAEMGGLPAGAGFLEKPFESGELLAMVRGVLGRSGTVRD